jgi:hypothetical protein
MSLHAQAMLWDLALLITLVALIFKYSINRW